MKAIIIGGSGATGQEIIKQLLTNNLYTEIVSLVRKKTSINHTKLKEIVVDFDKLTEYKNDMFADVAFSCLGTTLKAAGSKEAQWKIDYQYQLDFAKIVKDNNVKNFVLISSAYANSQSKFYYMKMKGGLEDEVIKLGFNQTLIFQPPSLIRPNSNRNGEIIGVKIIKTFNKIGLFKSFKPLHVSDLASAMIHSINKLSIGNHTLKPLDIQKMIPISQ